MNILFFSRALPCHGIGGMELVAWNLATGLANKGHTGKIITTATTFGSACQIPTDLSHCLSVEYLSNTSPGRYSRYWWRASRLAYLRELDRFAPDIVVSISVGAKSILATLGKVPAVMQAHGTALGEFSSKVRSGRIISVVSSIRDLFWLLRDLTMYRRFQKIIAVGPAVRDGLENPLIRLALPKDRAIMIPNGVDTNVFRPDTKAKFKIRKQLQIPETAKVLVWVSRLHRQKGIHLAFKALSHLNQDNVWFLLVGGGPERKKLQYKSQKMGISDRVIFAGEVPHNELPLFLSAGDVFVFTTVRHEVGLTLNVLEAMSMNLPCVISQHVAEDVVGCMEHIEGMYLVLPTRLNNVTEGISKALVDTSDGRRSFVKKSYSKIRMLDMYEEALFRVINA